MTDEQILPTPADALLHRARMSAFSNEIVWRLQDDRLLWRDVKTGENGAVSLEDVSEAQIMLEPALRGSAQRICRLRTRAGVIHAIAAVHRAGLLAREDRSESWRPFVRATLERVRAANPQARLRHGMGALGFALALNALALLLIGFAYAVQAYGEALFTPRVMAGLALIAFGAPNLVVWLRENRPGRPWDALL
jgi:hypothetical protein